MEYVLDAANMTVEFYSSANPNTPYLKQPFHPVTGKTWESLDEMNAWAESYAVGIQIAKASAVTEEAASA